MVPIINVIFWEISTDFLVHSGSWRNFVTSSYLADIRSNIIFLGRLNHPSCDVRKKVAAWRGSIHEIILHWTYFKMSFILRVYHNAFANAFSSLPRHYGIILRSPHYHLLQKNGCSEDQKIRLKNSLESLLWFRRENKHHQITK